MFSQVFFAAEPPSEEGEASGVAKYVSSASSALGKGAEKAKPILTKMGSLLLSAAKKAGELSMKGIRGSVGAIKSRLNGDKETEESPVDDGTKGEP